MCKEAGEEMNHHLLHCDFSMRLWWDMFRWFGTSWEMPRIVKELMFSLKSRKRMRRCRAWAMISLALMLVVWRERNRKSFGGLELRYRQLRSSLRFLIFFRCIIEFQVV